MRVFAIIAITSVLSFILAALTKNLAEMAAAQRTVLEILIGIVFAIVVIFTAMQI